MISAGELRDSVRGYLNHDNADRLAIRTTLDSIKSRLPDSETVIFGGMLRDFALGNAREFSSDIDLVSLATREDIAKAVEQFSPVRNKFGGYRFAVKNQIYDIWAFEDTWAFREGFVEGTDLLDLLKTTFFNVDASAYSISRDCCYISPVMQSSIEAKLLDINLAENPSPDGMLRRAIRMGCEENFAIGEALANFLLRHLRLQHLDRVSCMFMLGLKKHVEHGSKSPYRFSPQLTLFP